MNGTTIEKSEVLVLFLATAVVELVIGKIYPAAPIIDLSLILTAYVGWYSSPVKGGLCGAAFGLIHDGMLGLPLGINGISKTIVGFSAHLLRLWLVPEGLLARTVLLTLLAAVDNAMVYGTLFLLGRPLRPGFGWDFILETGITGLAGSIIFKVYDRVKFPRKDFRRS